MRLRHSRGGGNLRAAGPWMGSLREAACRDFAPAGDLLFFACPKKRRQKKRHPGRSVALGATALRCSVFVGGAETRSMPSALRSDICPKSDLTKRADARTHKALRCSTALKGPRNTLASFAGLVLAARFASCSRAGRAKRAPVLEAMRSEPCRTRGWRRGAQGLRGARASAHQRLTSRLLSERSARRARSELGAAPQDRAPQSSPAFGRTATVGSPFLGYFFWRSKRSNSPAGARPGSSLTQ
jgi:hypothetical protein